MTEQKQSVVIIATPDEIYSLLKDGKVTEDTPCLTLSQVFDVLLEYYGYEPGFAPNDVY